MGTEEKSEQGEKVGVRLQNQLPAGRTQLRRRKLFKNPTV